jgi:hypothetical protein
LIHLQTVGRTPEERQMTMAFAADSNAGFHCFYLLPPWHAAQQVGSYFVLRLDAAHAQALSSDAAPPLTFDTVRPVPFGLALAALTAPTTGMDGAQL